MSVQSATQLRPEIDAVLSHLRGRIRRYVFLEGLALVVSSLGLLFWLSLGLDWAWFEVSKLELPVWFRMLFDIAAVCLVVSGLITWIVLRLVRSLHRRALALVLERRFPELDDRLITAVETAESSLEAATPLTASMMQRTIDDVAQAAQSLEVGQVFEKKPLRRALIGAVVMTTSIVAFGLANADAMDRWWRAFNLLDPQTEYWNRETELVAHVVAQPGERIKQFQDAQGISTAGRPGIYKHPRGGDLLLVVEVPETNAAGKPLIVPERIELQYRLAQGRGSGRAYLSRYGDRQFKHSISGLQESMEFWITGGDYTNRAPYRIAVVEAPRVDLIVLENDYPDYTGMDVRDLEGNPTRDQQIVQGTQVSVPRETDIVMHITTNKPLQAARILTSSFEVNLSAQAASLTVLSQEGQPQRTISLPKKWAAQMLSAESGPIAEFRVPFFLSGKAETLLAELETPADFGEPSRIPLPSDSALRIYLDDADGIASLEPARLTVTGIADLPPTIQTRLRGVGNIITRKAVIPVEGRISDDYGIETARFDYRLDEGGEWTSRVFVKQPRESPREFVLQREEGEPFERFEVLRLELAIGQKLSVTVFAEDGDHLGGPHSSRSDTYTFKIVTSEELLTVLYGKELNLRRQFEQIIKEVEETRGDLILHRTRVEELHALQKASPQAGDEQKHKNQLREIETSIVVAAERSLHKIRKNAGETASIEVSFGEILEELVNNAVHTRQMVDRIEGLIVRPLHNVNEIDFPNVDRTLGLFKLANEKGNDPTPAIDQSVAAIETMLAHMKGVLKEMRDLVEFHEAVKELKEIITTHEDVSEATKLERKKKLLERLKGLQ